MRAQRPLRNVLAAVGVAPIVVLAPVGAWSQAPAIDRSEKGCIAAGRAIAAAPPPIPPATQIVATHFAATTRRCYVLLTLISDGPPAIAANIRTLYRGESRQVLALASDQGGVLSGAVYDPAHVVRGMVQNGYADALGYIDSKMSFDDIP
jgi:hypothetical protein